MNLIIKALFIAAILAAILLRDWESFVIAIQVGVIVIGSLILSALLFGALLNTEVFTKDQIDTEQACEERDIDEWIQLLTVQEDNRK